MGPLFPTTPLFPHLTVATAEIKSTFPPSLSPHLARCNLIGRRRNFPSLQLSASFVPSLLLLLFVDVAAGAAQCQSLSRKLDVDPSSHPKSSSGFPPFFCLFIPSPPPPFSGRNKGKKRRDGLAEQNGTFPPPSHGQRSSLVRNNTAAAVAIPTCACKGTRKGELTGVEQGGKEA